MPQEHILFSEMVERAGINLSATLETSLKQQLHIQWPGIFLKICDNSQKIS